VPRRPPGCRRGGTTGRMAPLAAGATAAPCRRGRPPSGPRQIPAVPRPPCPRRRPIHRPARRRTLVAPAPCQLRQVLCIVARRMAAYSVGIDVGGTFTDCFVTDGVDGMSRPLPTLVPRRRIAEVRERIDRDGAVLVPLDEGSVLAAADRLVRTEGVESLAVCLLWSCRNPAHERRVAAIVRERYPD